MYCASLLIITVLTHLLDKIDAIPPFARHIANLPFYCLNKTPFILLPYKFAMGEVVKMKSA